MGRGVRRQIAGRRCLESAVSAAVEALERRFCLSTSYIVDSLQDVVAADGFVTLREALQAANTDLPVHDAPAGTGADVIQFDPTLFVGGAQTLVLGGTQLSITADLTLTGPGANLLTIDANNASRILSVTSAVSNASISGLTLTKGKLTSGWGAALELSPATSATLRLSGLAVIANTAINGSGAIYTSSGTTEIRDCLIANNTERGIVAAHGTLYVINSTISGNTSTQYGAGIHVGGDTVVIRNSTITANRGNTSNGSSRGSGLSVLGGSVSLHNSIVAGNYRNSTGTTADDVSGTFSASSGYNVIGSITNSTGLTGNNTQYGTESLPQNALLNPLATNGGPTASHRPLAGSIAINAGDPARAIDASGTPLSTDQRGPGYARVVGGSVDIGAIEAPALPAEIGSISGSIWSDRDLDSQREADDLGVRQAPVRLYLDDGDGVAELGTADALVQGRDTDILGAYTFGNLPAGNYWVDIDDSSPAMTGYKRLSAIKTRWVSLSASQQVQGIDTIYYRPIVVTIAADEDDGNTSASDISLREALALAAATPGTDVVDFGFTSAAMSLSATLGDLIVDSDVLVNGSTMGAITIAAAAGHRAMQVIGGVTATLSAIGLTGSYVTSGGALYVHSGATANLSEVSITSGTASQSGGAIYNAGTLRLRSTTITASTAVDGGAIYSGGLLDLGNTTLHANSATRDGGAIDLVGGTTVMTNVTLTQNRADSDGLGGGAGGAIRIATGAVLTMHNTLIAGNLSGGGTTRDDVTGNVSSISSFNLVSTAEGMVGFSTTPSLGNRAGTLLNPLDPKMARLTGNGGNVSTYSLSFDSPANESGSNVRAAEAGLGTDARGVSRTQDFDRDGVVRVDIGAYESNPKIIVSTLVDESDTDYSDGDLSLREATSIAAANAGLDVIAFASSVSDGAIMFPDSGSAGPIDLFSDVCLIGPGAGRLTVDANRKSRVMRISSEFAVVQGITLARGEIPVGAGDGVGIYVYGGTATLRDVTINDCAEKWNAFDGVSTSDGGGIYNAGKLFIYDSKLTNNYARSYHFNGQSGPPNTGGGGGIYNAVGAQLVVDHTLFTGNSAARHGGGVYNSFGATATVTNSVFTLNRDRAGQQFTGYGGAILNAGVMTISGCEISYNGTNQGVGAGGIYNDTDADLRIENSTVYSNTYSGAGSSVGGIESHGKFTAINVTVAGNRNGEYANWGAFAARIHNSVFDGLGDGYYGLTGLTDTGVLTPDSAGNFISLTHVTDLSAALGNVWGSSAQISSYLGAFADNGGFGRTLAPLANSPLVDRGNATLAVDVAGDPLAFDQRGQGYPRRVGVNVDIGAYEVGGEASAGDRVWNDADADGVFDAAEVGIDGVPVALYASDGDNRFEPGTGDTLIGTRHTQLGGQYQFTNLSPGEYWASVDTASATLTGFVNTSPVSPFRFTLAAQEVRSDLDFGFRPRIVVSTTTDENDANLSAGDLSLREALGFARSNPGSDIIEFAPELAGQFINLASLGPLAIDSNVRILGLSDRVTINADSGSRVLSVLPGVTASIDDVNLVGGQSTDGAGVYIAGGASLTLTRVNITASNATQRGGAVFVSADAAAAFIECEFASNVAVQKGGAIYSEGTLSLQRTTLAQNRAQSASAGIGRGGAVYLSGVATISNCTIDSNEASFRGGGFYIESASVSITNATITDNRAAGTAANSGGGIYNDFASLFLANTIVTGNLRGAGAGAADNVVGDTDPLGTHNLLGVDARLMPLADYGGPTRTRALRIDSPAIEAGSNVHSQAAGLVTDARGLSRYIDQDSDGIATVDIGAVEGVAPLIVNASLDEATDTDGRLCLREAVALSEASAGFDLIRFDDSLFAGGVATLELTQGELVINESLELDGPADAQLVLSGLGLSRLLRVNGGGFVLLSDLTLADGSAATGGAVINLGRLDLQRVLLRDNDSAGSGGAIYNLGELNLYNTTLSGNAARDSGGGLYNSSGTARMVNVTVADNDAFDGAGGGIAVGSGSVKLSNTVVALNRRAGDPNDVAGGFSSDSSYNFIGAIDGSGGLSGTGSQFGTTLAPADPRLTPLQDNAGPTWTHGHLPASPLSDTGNDALASGALLTTDARNLPRFRDGTDDNVARVDVGAFEQQYPLNRAPDLSTISTIRGAAEGRPFAIRYDQLLAASDASDADGDTIYFRIESVDQGTLLLNGSLVVAGQTLLGPGAVLSWTPAMIDFGGSTNRTVPAFSVIATDGQVVSSAPVAVNVEVTTSAEPVNYVVLYSGGDRVDLNYPIYYQNLKRTYEAVTGQFGVRPDDIYVVYADGRSSAPDQKGNLNSDMAFAKNVVAATRDNLRQTLVGLSQKVDANDHVLFWVFDHGLGTPQQTSVTGEEVIKGWGAGEVIGDEELAVWLQGLKPGQSASTFGVPTDYTGVNAGFSTYVMGQCFAGGMLDDLTTNDTVFGAAASNHYEASYADYFIGGFTEALERGYNTTAAAFRYALNKDSRARSSTTPNGGTWSFNIEHPWSAGGDFPIFATDRLANAAPEIRSTTPLKLLSGNDLSISFDMLKAAIDAVDPSGQAPSYQIVGVDIGQLLSGGNPVNLADIDLATIAYGESLTWRRPAGSNGVLNALRVRAVSADGSASNEAVLPIRIGEPTSGVVGHTDVVLIQGGTVDALIEPASNDQGVGARAIHIGQPLHGSAVLDPLTGQVRYTPSAEFLGSDVLTYVVSDGVTSDVAQVLIEVVSFDPSSAADESSRYGLTELPPPPGWSGLPQSWDWAYRDSLPDWTSTRAVDISDEGMVLVKTSRPNSSDGSINFVGSTTATYRWQAGELEPYWNTTPDGSITATNTLLTLVQARDPDTGTPLLHNGLEVFDGIEATSLRNTVLTPHLRYLNPDNANEAGFPSIGGMLYNVGEGENEVWEQVPEDLVPIDVSSEANNSPMYYVAAQNLSSTTLRPWAELWQMGQGESSTMLMRIVGTGGLTRSYAYGIGKAGALIGTAEYASDDFKGFVYNGASTLTLQPTAGFAESAPLAINAGGVSVGFSGNSFGYLDWQNLRSSVNFAGKSGVATLWSAEGAATSLGTLGGTGWSIAYDVNDAGIAVGASNGKAVIWTNGAVHDLNGLVNSLPAGVMLTEARGINSSGQIVATGSVDGQVRAYVLDLASALQARDDAGQTSSQRIVQFNVLENDVNARSLAAVNDSATEGEVDWLSNGQITFDPAGDFDDLQPGESRTTEFSYIARDVRGGSQEANVSITVEALSTFHVASYETGSSGFKVTLSADLDASQLNLYDGLDDASEATDVELTNASGTPVRGSAKWDAESKTLEFVATGGALSGGSYTLTLAGRSDGIVSTTLGALDGNADDQAGGDFVRTFEIAAGTRSLILGDFARGPGQQVDVISGLSGIPVSVSDAAGLRSADFELHYDPSLLSIESIAKASGLPTNWGLTVNLSPAGRPGVAIISLSGITALEAGSKQLLQITARVPDDAPYGSTHLIRIQPPINASTGQAFDSVQLNGGAIACVGDTAVHKVAYLGDASGNHGYSGFDGSMISRVVVQLDSGFDAYPLTDPRLIGDTDRNGSLSGYDASLVAAKSIDIATPQIPDLPGLLSPIVDSGEDPTVSVGAASAKPGQGADVGVSIDNASGVLSLDNFRIHYDPAKLNLLESGVSVGSLLAGWTTLVTVDQANGLLRLTAFGTTPLPAGATQLLNLHFTVAANATPGATTVSVDAQSQLNEGSLPLTPVNGSVTITPASSTVLNRRTFYNQSLWDGTSLTSSTGRLANASDDAAIATDKTAYLPGTGIATRANVTSYNKGINGILIDIADLPAGVNLSTSDFTFRTGNNNTPSGWATAASPFMVLTRPGAGVNGSTRVHLVWEANDLDGVAEANEAVAKGWLQVTMLANANTGLARNDVFYFGNAVGDTFDSSVNTAVNATDEAGARNNPKSGFGVANQAPITFAYDFNRDKAVNATDQAIARANPTTGFNDTNYINLAG